MKYILVITALFFLQSCKKDEDKKACYECDFYQNNIFNDVGCYTPKEWNEKTFTTLDGRALDKNRCTKK